VDSIPPAPRGMPQIEVSFDVDANGILKVTAKDKASNKEQSIKIEASSGLSESDIKSMQGDAEKHEKDDQEKRELIETKNIAEQLIYTSEKSLKEYGDKAGDDLKKEVQEKIDALKKTMEGNDRQTIRNASDALSTSVSRIGEAMSKQGDTTTNENKKDDNTGKEDKGTVRDAETE